MAEIPDTLEEFLELYGDKRLSMEMRELLAEAIIARTKSDNSIDHFDELKQPGAPIIKMESDPLVSRLLDKDFSITFNDLYYGSDEKFSGLISGDVRVQEALEYVYATKVAEQYATPQYELFRSLADNLEAPPTPLDDIALSDFMMRYGNADVPDSLKVVIMNYVHGMSGEKVVLDLLEQPHSLSGLYESMKGISIPDEHAGEYLFADESIKDIIERAYKNEPGIFIDIMMQYENPAHTAPGLDEVESDAVNPGFSNTGQNGNRIKVR